MGDLGPPKTLKPNFGFGSVTNKNFDENTPPQIEEYISKRLLTGTKPEYDKHEKTRKNVLVGCKDQPDANGYSFTFFSTFFLSPIFVYFAKKVNPRCLLELYPICLLAVWPVLVSYWHLPVGIFSMVCTVFTWRNHRLPSPTRISLEEPSGYPAQPGLTWRNRRLPSPTRINLEEP